MANRPSLGQVYDQLKQDGFVEDEQAINSTEFNKQNNSPWFIQGLMGCGGWIAALFTLGVVGSCISTILVNMDELGVGIFLLIVGSIFVVATSIASRTNDDLGIFATRLILTLHIAGHFLLIIGFGMTFQLWNTDRQMVIVSVFTIILQIVFIVLYPNGIYRFLATLLISYCLAWIAFTYELPILISIATGGLMLLAILVWADKLPSEWQIKYLSMLQPIGYGAIIAAFGLMIYEVSNRYYYYDVVPPNTATVTTILLFICLIWVEVQLLQEYQIRLNSPFALTIFGISAIVSLPIYATPGILAAIVAILLAFRRRNRILLGIAYLYLAGFIIYYYYWLDVTLLTKSIILMITGVLLIAARLFLRRIVIVPDEMEGLSA